MSPRALRIVQGLPIAIASLVWPCSAWAGNEYVNPTFCYRLVQPQDASHVLPNPDGSGIAMDIGSDCERHGCAHIAIAASYLWDTGNASQLYPHALSEGWVLKAKVQKSTPGAVWIEYRMTRGDAWMDVYETSSRHDQARYRLTAQSTAEQGPAAQRAVAEILASWRWLSACL